MRMCWIVLLAACQSVPVTVGSSPERDGVRVFFRRDLTERGGRREELARLSADGGRLTGIVHSPDGTAVSALWLGGAGAVTCRFPGGGAGRFEGDPGPDDPVEYVFLEERGASVTARLARNCPLTATLTLTVRLKKALLPATLAMPGGAREITETETRVAFSIPRNRDRLLGGDHWLRLNAAHGRRFSFAIGIDPDGTPAAVHGYVRNWGAALD